MHPTKIYKEDLGSGAMKRVNTFLLTLTISIIDYLYRGRHFQRFWVLEEIAHTLFCIFKRVTSARIFRFARSMAHLSNGGTFCSNS